MEGKSNTVLAPVPSRYTSNSYIGLDAMTRIGENRLALEADIAAAASGAGCDPAEVRLIAVSKKQPMERITAALEAGQRIFGENRVQEAAEHWRDIKEKERGRFPGLELHLIGPLQTNKVRDAVALFDFIHTVDRPKLADAIAAEAGRQGRHPVCFIQVNTGEEEQKHGVIPRELPKLLEYCRGECGLEIRGLMCIPPLDEPPAMHFALLAKLARRHNLPELSMGMSGDFEKAVALGATCVRIGTAFFGGRL